MVMSIGLGADKVLNVVVDGCLYQNILVSSLVNLYARNAVFGKGILLLFQTILGEPLFEFLINQFQKNKMPAIECQRSLNLLPTMRAQKLTFALRRSSALVVYDGSSEAILQTDTLEALPQTAGELFQKAAAETPNNGRSPLTIVCPQWECAVQK